VRVEAMEFWYRFACWKAIKATKIPTNIMDISNNRNRLIQEERFFNGSTDTFSIIFTKVISDLHYHMNPKTDALQRCKGQQLYRQTIGFLAVSSGNVRLGQVERTAREEVPFDFGSNEWISGCRPPQHGCVHQLWPGKGHCLLAGSIYLLFGHDRDIQPNRWKW
jgi:hypothetical protein